MRVNLPLKRLIEIDTDKVSYIGESIIMGRPYFKIVVDGHLVDFVDLRSGDGENEYQIIKDFYLSGGFG